MSNWFVSGYLVAAALLLLALYQLIVSRREAEAKLARRDLIRCRVAARLETQRRALESILVAEHSYQAATRREYQRHLDSNRDLN